MNRHRLDVLSFVAGVAFITLGIAFLATDGDVVDGARWVWPLLLLALGGAGLASTLRRD
jgi:hypothetical protein